MSGIQSITDDCGEKTAGVIHLKVQNVLWEDIQDVPVSQSRKKEKAGSIQRVRARLITAGKLRG